MIRDNRDWNLGTGHCNTLAVKVMVCIRKLQQRINYTTNFHHSSVCANCFNLHYVNFTTLAIQQGVEEWPSMKSPYTFILHKIYFKGGQLVRSKVSGGGGGYNVLRSKVSGGQHTMGALYFVTEQNFY